jgi:stage II sporulation SpoAA-like protein
MPINGNGNAGVMPAPLLDQSPIYSSFDAFGPVISAKISGELSKSEVSQMQAAALAAIRRCGKISALLILEDFQGWKRESEWGDITFLIEHDNDISRIAVVGGEQWRDFVDAFLAKGFRQAAVEYFLPADLAKAHDWLAADSRASPV